MTVVVEVLVDMWGKWPYSNLLGDEQLLTMILDTSFGSTRDFEIEPAPKSFYGLLAHWPIQGSTWTGRTAVHARVHPTAIRSEGQIRPE